MCKSSFDSIVGCSVPFIGVVRHYVRHVAAIRWTPSRTVSSGATSTGATSGAVHPTFMWSLALAVWAA